MQGTFSISRGRWYTKKWIFFPHLPQFGEGVQHLPGWSPLCGNKSSLACIPLPCSVLSKNQRDMMIDDLWWFTVLFSTTNLALWLWLTSSNTLQSSELSNCPGRYNITSCNIVLRGHSEWKILLTFQKII